MLVCGVVCCVLRCDATGLFSESAVLSLEHSLQLTDWLPAQFKKALLLHRSTRDGFDGKTFHSNCDGMAHTVVIGRTDKGFICGGFIGSAEWASTYPGA